MPQDLDRPMLCLPVPHLSLSPLLNHRPVLKPRPQYRLVLQAAGTDMQTALDGSQASAGRVCRQPRRSSTTPCWSSFGDRARTASPSSSLVGPSQSCLVGI